MTTNGDQFLIFDSSINDHQRIFIYASQLSLRLLREATDWYADGTFKICPELFYQLYTIHGQKNGQIFPSVFCLLPNKTEETYMRMIEVVLQHVGNHRLQSIMVDFERAAINAFSRINRNIVIKGCFFSFIF